MLELEIDGSPVVVEKGTTVAAAVWNSGSGRFRDSVSGEPRAPLCGMGICFECRVEIDGQPQERSCQRLCEAGMVVRTAGGESRGCEHKGSELRGSERRGNGHGRR